MMLMRIPGINDEGNIWKITEEEVRLLRISTMLELQSKRSKNGTESVASTPDSVCSEASLDLAALIPSPGTFFAEDFGTGENAPVPAHGDDAYQNQAESQKIVNPSDELEVLPNQQVQDEASTETCRLNVEVSTRHDPPPGFPPMNVPINSHGMNLGLDNTESQSSWRPSSSDYMAFPAHYCYINFRNVEFRISGPTQNGMIFPSIEYFHVVCFDPTGQSCFVSCDYSRPNPFQYVCNFYATIPGNYTVLIQYWDPIQMERPLHINRSPLVLSVSRDYKNAKLQTFSRIVYGQPQHCREINHVNTWGIDVNKYTKRVYVADKKANVIRAYTPEGVELTHLGHHTHGLLSRPSGIAVDHYNSRLVISDKDHHRIVFCDLDGIFIGSFGSWGFTDGHFQYPWGVAVSPNGDLIAVADSQNHRIQMFDQFGNYLRKYSVFEKNPFEYKSMFDCPRGICFDREGQYLYCTDFNIHVVFKFNVDLTDKTYFTVPGDLLRPQGLAVDEAGNILVCDKNHRVRVFTSKGEVMAVIDGNGHMQLPQDLCILPNGKLLILDGSGSIRFY